MLIHIENLGEGVNMYSTSIFTDRGGLYLVINILMDIYNPQSTVWKIKQFEKVWQMHLHSIVEPRGACWEGVWANLLGE